MDSLNAIRIFVAVADEGSFAGAARRLRITPAMATRAVSLTGAGAAYLLRARPALDELEDAARELGGGNAEPRGALVVTAPVLFGRLHVLPIVTGLLRRHPALDIRLTLNDRIVRLAEEGVDIAIRLAPLPDSALRAVRLGTVRRILVASPAYVTRRGAPMSPAALAGHEAIGFENEAPGNEWRFGEGAGHAVRLRPRLTLDNADAAIAAAIEGMGITRVLDYQVADALRDGRLIELLGEYAPAPVPASLLYEARRHGSANVRAFVAAARSHFAASPPTGR